MSRRLARSIATPALLLAVILLAPVGITTAPPTGANMAMPCPTEVEESVDLLHQGASWADADTVSNGFEVIEVDPIDVYGFIVERGSTIAVSVQTVEEHRVVQWDVYQEAPTGSGNCVQLRSTSSAPRPTTNPPAFTTDSSSDGRVFVRVYVDSHYVLDMGPAIPVPYTISVTVV